MTCPLLRTRVQLTFDHSNLSRFGSSSSLGNSLMTRESNEPCVFGSLAFLHVREVHSIERTPPPLFLSYLLCVLAYAIIVPSDIT